MSDCKHEWRFHQDFMSCAKCGDMEILKRHNRIHFCAKSNLHDGSFRDFCEEYKFRRQTIEHNDFYIAHLLNIIGELTERVEELEKK